MSDCEARLLKLENDVAANNLLAEGLEAAHQQILEWFAVLGGVEALQVLHDRILQEYDSLKERETHYVERMDGYLAESYDEIYDRIRQEIRQAVSDEIAFRKRLIEEIANRFHGVIPIRQATKAEIAAANVVLTRPASREEIKASN